jgi:cellulose synthase/poly-beta-1,6-N-acetylglucosamine synthase-like glycosyltransferase
LAVLSLSRKSPASSGNFTPSLSVLIAAYNEEKVIKATLQCGIAGSHRGG